MYINGIVTMKKKLLILAFSLISFSFLSYGSEISGKINIDSNGRVTIDFGNPSFSKDITNTARHLIFLRDANSESYPPYFREK